MEGKLRDLWAESRELSLGTTGAVDRLDAPPSSLRFLRDYVSPSKPCLISRSATLHWPALSHSLWSDAYLSRALADRPVSVHLTPDGRADSLAPLPSTTALCFASPCVQLMPIQSALRLIASRTSPLVAYAQQQNDCFRGEYSPLAGDVDTHIPFATDALGCLPEAVNLWIGSARSETSFHKDHYENLYVVITGEKHFLLLPPTDVHRLYVRRYPAARYSDSDSSQGELKLELEVPSREVPWCSVDPYPRSLEEIRRQRSAFPLYFEGGLRPIECTVKAGEILYLPSMWFHHVRQTPDRDGRTIAINYWYDMQFDIKYAYFNFLQSIQCPDDDVLQSIQCPDDDVLQSIQCPDDDVVVLQSIQCPDDDDDVVLQSIQCPDDDDVVLQSIQCPNDDDDVVVLQSIQCPDDDDVMQLRNNTSSDHLESEENIHTVSS